MLQKIIQVGNSLAVTIPSSFVKEVKLKAGQRVMVDGDSNSAMLTMQSIIKPSRGTGITPEFLSWLKKFNNKYKNALTELAKK